MFSSWIVLCAVAVRLKLFRSQTSKQRSGLFLEPSGLSLVGTLQAHREKQAVIELNLRVKDKFIRGDMGGREEESNYG